ncbi:restriction endonuclease [Halosimplex sp. TS25]|uniref:restriction endonuclease n=1 Tax=Halosimplex rarum TaxID=3396619 RepID=UPI0039EA75AF
MEHVIEVEDGDAAVLRETGSGGLIARGLLADRPLGEYVEPAETPRYVVRNKKRGVSIERTDEGDADGERDAEGALAPDGDHTAAALVTDARVLFAVGRADGDRTRSVALSDVVDARTEDGFLGGALVVDTVDGLQYRFPTRGDLDAVREFVDGAAGVWARAERHLEAAADALDRADAQFGSGDAEGVLPALDEAREALEAARDAAASLDGAAATLADRFESARGRLRDCERRAYAGRAEAFGERAQARREDGDYEQALDLLERADESYAAALSVDAGLPTDRAIERHRDRLATERDRLTSAPLERAEAAVEKASAADDPETAVEWWERALDRYETLRALDWGRGERRFAGDRDTVRERLAIAAEQLVAAHCERARRAIDLAEDAPPDAAAAADERAASALDAAHDVARERVPDELDAVERLRDRLAERRAARSESEGEPSDDARETVVVTPDGDEAPATDVQDDTAAEGDDATTGAGDEDAPSDGTEAPPSDVDEEIANALAEAMAGDVDDSIAEAVDETIAGTGVDEAGAVKSEAEPDADGSADDPVPVGSADEPNTDREGWVFVDDETDDDWMSAERTEDTDADSEGSGGESDDGDAASDDGDADAGESVRESQTRIEPSGSESTESADATRSTDGLASLDPERFRELVADLFESTGWEVESPGSTLVAYDIRVTTPDPVTITAAILTVDSSSAPAVGPDDVDRFAATVERAQGLDEAVVVTGACLPERARERVTDRGVRVVGPDALSDQIDAHGVSIP